MRIDQTNLMATILVALSGLLFTLTATHQGSPTEKARAESELPLEANIELERDGKHFILKPPPFQYAPHVVRSPRSSFGSPWPQPRLITTNPRKVFNIDINSFTFSPKGPSCDVITHALKRYFNIIKDSAMPMFKDNILNSNFYKTSVDNTIPSDHDRITSTGLDSLVVVYSRCDEYPTLTSNESYVISINVSGAFLHAEEAWGVLWGLETFSQIVIQGPDAKLYVRESRIEDRPRFPHRGVLIDTGRHYIYKSVIKDVLDGMAFNKMNVLHWHIVDDQSFPFQSRTYPELSRKGAFHPSMVYTHDDVTEIIEYARLRGIRVIPEFDTPGHTLSWGLGYPEIKANCATPAGQGPINPMKNVTWSFLEGLFKEIMGLFPDKFLHLGGDEVHSPCWISDATIRNYFNQSSVTIPLRDTRAFNKIVEAIYFERLLERLNKFASTRKQGASYIVWDEAVSKGLKNAAGNHKIIAHVWQSGVATVRQRIEAGYQAIYSSCWYLDHIKRGPQWTQYYTCEPSPYTSEQEERGKVLGGEVCLWGEYVDNEFLMARLWPYASAAAERLWSPKKETNINTAGPRMQEQRCRMLRRGLAVGNAGGPDYCPRTSLNFKFKDTTPAYRAPSLAGKFSATYHSNIGFVWSYVKQEELKMFLISCSIQGCIVILIFWYYMKKRTFHNVHSRH